MRIPEGKERDKERSVRLKGIMAENFLNLGKEIDIQIHKA